MTTPTLMDFVEDVLNYNPGRTTLANSMSRAPLGEPLMLSNWVHVLFVAKLLGCDLEAETWALLGVSRLTGPTPTIESLELGRQFLHLLSVEAQKLGCMDPRVVALTTRADEAYDFCLQDREAAKADRAAQALQSDRDRL